MVKKGGSSLVFDEDSMSMSPTSEVGEVEADEIPELDSLTLLALCVFVWEGERPASSASWSSLRRRNLCSRISWTFWTRALLSLSSRFRMKHLALFKRPRVVWRLDSAPSGTSSFKRSRHPLKCALRFFSSSLWVVLLLDTWTSFLVSPGFFSIRLVTDLLPWDFLILDFLLLVCMRSYVDDGTWLDAYPCSASVDERKWKGGEKVYKELFQRAVIQTSMTLAVMRCDNETNRQGRKGKRPAPPSSLNLLSLSISSLMSRSLLMSKSAEVESPPGVGEHTQRKEMARHEALHEDKREEKGVTDKSSRRKEREGQLRGADGLTMTST